MKIIITESQYDLIRRLETITPIVIETLSWNDPCEYSRFEQYNRIVINEVISNMIARYQLEKSFRTIKEVDDFRTNVMNPLFGKMIKDHYDSFNDLC